jgi:flagellin
LLSRHRLTTNTSLTAQTLTQEAEYLVAEFTRSATSSEFNTMTLLDGSFTGKYFQVGANYAQRVTFSITDARGRSVEVVQNTLAT